MTGREGLERQGLEQRAAEARASLVEGVHALGQRLEPRYLVASAADRARSAAKAELDEALAATGAWVRDHSLWMVGAAALMGVLAAIGVRARRKVVPVERAYSMEDPTMNDMEEPAHGRWDRVKDAAADLSAKAGETYYHARSKAAELSVVAKDRAADAVHVAEDAAGRAADWTKRQPQENPMTSVILGFAFGAILAALLPKGGRSA
jgi:ElaB/YqjD/DUF883 family membrane-anchored ribosome-binding protein